MVEPMSHPRITIVTPSYNQAAYLEQTICSVLNQDDPNLEYIIVDGGSTDGSVEIIRRYEHRLAWWVSEKDSGQAHAINKGFARATGDIFAYLNSDDVLVPGALAYVRKRFSAGVRWLAGGCQFITTDGKIQPWKDERKCTRVDWLVWNSIPQPSVFWSAEDYRRAGEFREDLHYVFDWEYWLRLRFVFGVPLVIEPQVLSRYRLHEASKTVAESSRFEPEYVRVRDDYKKYLTRLERGMLAWRLRKHEAGKRRSAAWRSHQAGDRRASRRHAWVAVLNRPLWTQAWRVLLYVTLPDRVRGGLRRLGMWR